MEMIKLNAKMDPEVCRGQGGDNTVVPLTHNEEQVPCESAAEQSSSPITCQ